MSPITLDESLISLNEASKRLPNQPHCSTLWRWYRRGIRGILLETIAIAGRRYTSIEALDRFVARTTAAASSVPLPIHTPRQRQAAIERAESELANCSKPRNAKGGTNG